MTLLLFLLLTVRISVPYVLAALGGAISERSGVVNLALEGMMLSGAFFAALGAHLGGVGLGVLGGLGGGLLIAALYAVCVLFFRADQVVAGVAMNLLAIGLTRYLLKFFFHSVSSSPSVPGFSGPLGSYAFVGVAVALVALVHIMMQRTAVGLRLRAVGENPHAADSLGVHVLRVRGAAVLASGLLAGLAGAWLLLDNPRFVDQMSGGRGYIALAAMIFGRWRPVWAAAACLLFGCAEALEVHLQTEYASLSHELLATLPYVVTLVALTTQKGVARAPAALGKPPPGR